MSMEDDAVAAPIAEDVQDIQQKNKVLGRKLITFWLLMTFIGAPVLYITGDMLCDWAGIGLNPDEATKELGGGTGRFVSVEFKKRMDAELEPLIVFRPSESRQSNQVGELSSLHYTLKNLSDETLYIRPIHNVTPAQAARAFLMTECFCYNDTELRPGAELILPVTYGFQDGMDVRVRQALVSYDLRRISKEEMRDPEEAAKFKNKIVSEINGTDQSESENSGNENPGNKNLSKEIPVRIHLE